MQGVLKRFRSGFLCDGFGHDPGPVAVRDDDRRTVQRAARYSAGAVRRSLTYVTPLVAEEAHVDGLDMGRIAIECDTTEHASKLIVAGTGTPAEGVNWAEHA